MRYTAIIVLLAAILPAASTAVAKNVDLVTLPDRDTVQLTIYNSEDLTLVKETRSITLTKGLNKLQFSWANTLIDPTSVTFRPLERKDQVELLDTVFPGQKPQHLIWRVESQFEGQVTVEVTYFTSGLTWQMDYVGITDAAEEAMHFRGYVRVFNNSGEQYDNTEIRLIVGTINLVEKIAELARRRGIPVPTADAAPRQRSELRLEAAGSAFGQVDALHALRKPEIVKEGLSEYFMFSVAGRESIPDGWSKRMQAVEAHDVAFDIVYRQREYQYGGRPVRFFIWRNDDEHKLGDSPLPDGQVNLFRRLNADGDDDAASNGGLAFLARQKIRYVPIKAAIEINLGPDDLVVYETRRMGTERMNFHFHRSGNTERVDGWDETTRWIDTIRNYRTKPIVLELRRRWDGDVNYESEVATTLFDYRTPQTLFSIPPRDKTQYPAAVTVHMGVNSKQKRVKLRTP